MTPLPSPSRETATFSLLEQQAHYAACRERLGMGTLVPRIRLIAAPLALCAPLPVEDEASPANSRVILEQVAANHGVSVDDIRGRDRRRQFSAARQEAAYRMRMETPLSLPQIAARLGRADHSSIVYAINKHAAGLVGK